MHGSWLWLVGVHENPGRSEHDEVAQPAFFKLISGRVNQATIGWAAGQGIRRFEELEVERLRHFRAELATRESAYGRPPGTA